MHIILDDVHLKEYSPHLALKTMRETNLDAISPFVDGAMYRFMYTRMLPPTREFLEFFCVLFTRKAWLCLWTMLMRSQYLTEAPFGRVGYGRVLSCVLSEHKVWNDASASLSDKNMPKIDERSRLACPKSKKINEFVRFSSGQNCKFYF